MSWLARSIANTLHLDEQEEEDVVATVDSQYNDVARHRPDDVVPSGDQRRETSAFSAGDQGSLGSDSDEDHESDENDQGRGVKEDLTEFGDSVKHQLWGVASFLAPPPPPRRQKLGLASSESKSDRAVSDSEAEESSQFGESTDYSQTEDCSNVIEDVVGITEEVLAFARNIAHHPETWLDFLLTEEEEFDDFDISDVQYKHVLAVEYLAPRLAALRIELCPTHMSVGYFWMVYFVLLHSRLNRHDADLLSSPQLVQARAMWMQELHKKTKEESYWSGTTTKENTDSPREPYWLGTTTKENVDSPFENFSTHSYEDAHFSNMSDRTFRFESSTMLHMTGNHETEMHPDNEIEFIDKSVIKEDPPPEVQEKQMVIGLSIKLQVQDDDTDDDDDWLKEDSDVVGYSDASIMGNEEDISFSDLEDDIDCTMPIKSKTGPTDWNMTKTS